MIEHASWQNLRSPVSTDRRRWWARVCRCLGSTRPSRSQSREPGTAGEQRRTPSRSRWSCTSWRRPRSVAWPTGRRSTASDRWRRRCSRASTSRPNPRWNASGWWSCRWRSPSCCKRNIKKVKACFYIALYPVRWTAQSVLHFTPWQTCSFRLQLDFSGKHSSHAAITRND